MLVGAALLATSLGAQEPRETPKQDAAALLQQVGAEHEALLAAKSAREKAKHWFLLSDSAERYLQVVNQELKTGSAVDRQQQSQAKAAAANKFEAGVIWCEFDASWTTNRKGYYQSYTLDPTGPKAEEAMWRGELYNSPLPCTDFEGSEQEYQDLAMLYSKFLRRFPHGVHAAEAKKRLQEFYKALEGYKQSQGR